MKASEFKPGDLANITVTGARLEGVEKNSLHFVMPNGTTVTVEMSNHPGVNIVRVAPAEWPPEPGDLWRREDFDQPKPADDGPDLGLWFAHFDHALDRGDARLILVPAHGDLEYAETRPERLLAQGGRWTLVHREQQTGGTS